MINFSQNLNQSIENDSKYIKQASIVLKIYVWSLILISLFFIYVFFLCFDCPCFEKLNLNDVFIVKDKQSCTIGNLDNTGKQIENLNDEFFKDKRMFFFKGYGSWD